MDRPDSPERPNVFFRLVIASATLFVITILAMTASIFGDPAAPPARFLNEYAGQLIAVEVAATLVFGFLALAVDRRRILRDRAAAIQEESEDKSEHT